MQAIDKLDAKTLKRLAKEKKIQTKLPADYQPPPLKGLPKMSNPEITTASSPQSLDCRLLVIQSLILNSEDQAPFINPQKDVTILDHDQSFAYKIFTFKRLTAIQEFQIGILNDYIVTKAAKD